MVREVPQLSAESEGPVALPVHRGAIRNGHVQLAPALAAGFTKWRMPLRAARCSSCRSLIKLVLTRALYAAGEAGREFTPGRLVLFNLTGETIKRFVASPSDRATVVRRLAESVGGSLECYYWTFGQYDGMGIFGLPDSHTMAAVSLAATSSGAFTRFETHELIEASDLTGIAERAQGIAYRPPGA